MQIGGQIRQPLSPQPDIRAVEADVDAVHEKRDGVGSYVSRRLRSVDHSSVCAFLVVPHGLCTMRIQVAKRYDGGGRLVLNGETV